ncbi:MAG: glycoside-pentoside-hexuronide (GPH):cation symporter [Erysipelotrichaceae bacterium]
MTLTKKTKASYGFGAIGKDMVYALVAGFLMYYYNVVLGISPAFIGTLFMVARIFDAFNDPIMGIIVNKTRGRFGKFRPWILTGTILNALVLVAMFSIPNFELQSTTVLFASVAYILWGVTYTMMDIPFWSFIPALTVESKDRENISVIARSCAGLGFAIPTALTMSAVAFLGKGDERLGFSLLAIGIGVFFILSAIVTFANVKERVVVEQEQISVKAMLQTLVQNDQAMSVVVAIIIFNASLYLTQNLALYFFKYDIGNAELFGIFGTIGGAAQILAMMSLPALRTKFTRLQIFQGALTTTIIGYIGLFVLGVLKIQNIVLLCLMAAIIFVGFGLATVLTTIFLADCVEYGEWKHGVRSESVIFSLQTFVVKFASALSVFIAGIGLEVIGLDTEAATQSATTLSALRFLMIVVPIVGLVLCILYFMKRYRLDDAYYEQIVSEIEARKES